MRIEADRLGLPHEGVVSNSAVISRAPNAAEAGQMGFGFKKGGG